MSDLNISLYQRGLNQDEDLKMPMLNLRRSFYGKFWYLVPDVLESEAGQKSSVDQNSRSKFREQLTSLRKRFWANVNDVPGGSPQSL